LGVGTAAAELEKKEKTGLHPQKLTWNLKMNPGKGDSY